MTLTTEPRAVLQCGREDLIQWLRSLKPDPRALRVIDILHRSSPSERETALEAELAEVRAALGEADSKNEALLHEWNAAEASAREAWKKGMLEAADLVDLNCKVTNGGYPGYSMLRDVAERIRAKVGV